MALSQVFAAGEGRVLWWACYRFTSLMATNHPLATDNLLCPRFLGQRCPLGKEDMLCEYAGAPYFSCSVFGFSFLFFFHSVSRYHHHLCIALQTTQPQPSALPPSSLPTHVTAIKSKQTRVSRQNKFCGVANHKIPPSFNKKPTENTLFSECICGDKCKCVSTFYVYIFHVSLCVWVSGVHETKNIAGRLRSLIPMSAPPPLTWAFSLRTGRFFPSHCRHLSCPASSLSRC